MTRGLTEVIESLFDQLGTAYYRVTFPDGEIAYTGCCWMCEILLKRWEEQRYAINYRGENLRQ